MVDVERIKVGKQQSIDTLISEEALLFAKFLRNERKEWIPRTVNIPKHAIYSKKEKIDSFERPIIDKLSSSRASGLTLF